MLFPLMWLCIGGFGAKLLLAKDQQHYVAFAATAVAYPNGFAIPYPILLGLRREVDFMQERGDEYSATVAILFAFFTMLHIWTVGFYLYGRAAKREREQEAEKVRKKAEAEAMAIEAEHGQASGSVMQSEHMQGQGGDGEGTLCCDPASQLRGFVRGSVQQSLSLRFCRADLGCGGLVFCLRFCLFERQKQHILAILRQKRKKGRNKKEDQTFRAFFGQKVHFLSSCKQNFD